MYEIRNVHDVAVLSRRTAALPESGRSDHRNLSEVRGRFRPIAVAQTGRKRSISRAEFGRKRSKRTGVTSNAEGDYTIILRFDPQHNARARTGTRQQSTQNFPAMRNYDLEPLIFRTQGK